VTGVTGRVQVVRKGCRDGSSDHFWDEAWAAWGWRENWKPWSHGCHSLVIYITIFDIAMV